MTKMVLLLLASFLVFTGVFIGIDEAMKRRRRKRLNNLWK